MQHPTQSFHKTRSCCMTLIWPLMQIVRHECHRTANLRPQTNQKDDKNEEPCEQPGFSMQPSNDITVTVGAAQLDRNISQVCRRHLYHLKEWEEVCVCVGGERWKEGKGKKGGREMEGRKREEGGGGVECRGMVTIS